MLFIHSRLTMPSFWGANSVFFVFIFLSAKTEVIQRNSKRSVGRVFCSAKHQHWWWPYIFSRSLLFSRDFHRLLSQLAPCNLWDRDPYTAFTCDHMESEQAWRLTQGQRTRALQSWHGTQHISAISRTMLSLLKICQGGKEVSLKAYARKR